MRASYTLLQPTSSQTFIHYVQAPATDRLLPEWLLLNDKGRHLTGNHGQSSSSFTETVVTVDTV